MNGFVFSFIARRNERVWNRLGRFLKTLIISSSKIVETSSELFQTSSELISTSSELISTGSELIRIIAEQMSFPDLARQFFLL